MHTHEKNSKNILRHMCLCLHARASEWQDQSGTLEFDEFLQMMTELSPAWALFVGSSFLHENMMTAQSERGCLNSGVKTWNSKSSSRDGRRVFRPVIL